MREAHGNVAAEVPEIDLHKARERLLEAVDTQGHDFVYNPNRGLCLYNPNPDDMEPNRQKTGCLIGTALKLAGIDTTPLDDGSGTNVIGLDMKCKHLFRLTKEATIYFQIAQQIQDHAGTWGQAYLAAEAYADTINARRYPGVNK